MVPPPVALALTLCDLVIVEEGTRKVSLLGTFSTFRARSYPFAPSAFRVFAVLTDGQGQARIRLSVTSLATDEIIHSVEQPVAFPDRFAEVQVLFHLHQCRFPAAGGYQFSLFVDGEWVAHRRVRVVDAGGQ